MMTMEEGWAYKHPDVEYFNTGCLLSFWVIAATVVFHGVIISTAYSQNDPLEWSLSLADMSFNGTMESLVFLCLYLFLITVGRPISKRLWRGIKTRPTDPPWLQKLSPPFNWLCRVTLPIAVILVWTQ